MLIKYSFSFYLSGNGSKSEAGVFELHSFPFTAL